jgi:hypothetical protein
LAFLAVEVDAQRRARNWSPLLLELDRMISSITLLLWKLWPRVAFSWKLPDFARTLEETHPISALNL